MKSALLQITAVGLFAWLVGCSNLPDKSSNDSSGTVPMVYVGTAQAGANEPITGCRVYAFKLNGYTQTAIYCNGKVTTASSHHQESDDDATSN